MTPPCDYLIVGSGVNGTSIASHLISLGFTVTLLDRSPDGFVAPDGASHDLNKIIRADYTDANYCSLAKEAISLWRSHPVLQRYYHEVGVLFRSGDAGRVWGEGEGSAEEYVRKGVEHAWLEEDGHLEVGGTMPSRRAYKLDSDKAVEEIFQGRSVVRGRGLEGMGTSQTGYFNPRGGWAEANNACRALLSHAIAQGVHVVPNANVASFIYDKDAIVGVETADKRTFHASRIVMATGAWTSDLLSRLLPSLRSPAHAGWMTRPSAQCVAILRLTPAEAASVRATPVVINFSSGFYQFEPVASSSTDREWLMKIAYHSNGYLYPKPPTECSGAYPSFADSQLPVGSRTVGSEGLDAGYDMANPTVPTSHLDAMLSELAAIYPALARREKVVGTRICWYSDTLDENWIVDTLDRHPSLCAATGGNRTGDNVWVVSGDSGHAYKFLPMIGSLFATVAGLQPNVRRLDLTKFTFAHQAKLHEDKAKGGAIKSADSNRVGEVKAVERNARARL